MDLDDQLAALAAGELEPDEARAVRARVAADPALRRQLARIERLDAVLADWDVPPMGEDVVARLDEAVTEALDALSDEPLVGDRPGVVGFRPRPLPDDRGDDPAVGPTGSSPGDPGGGAAVVAGPDRRDRRGLPQWVAGLTVAAAAVAVVGGLGTGVLRPADDSDMGAAEVAADDAAEDGDDQGDGDPDRRIAERAAPESLGSEAGDADTARDAVVGDGGATLLGPVVERDVDLTADDLAGLADRLLPAPTAPDDTLATGPADDGEAVGSPSLDALPASARTCVEAAAADDGRVLAAVATGTYEGIDAVVTMTFLSLDGATVVETRALALDDCATLAVVEQPRR